MKILLNLICAGLAFVIVSCGNDGVYNEETNRESVKRKTEKKDSLEKVEEFRLDSLHLKKIPSIR